MFGLARDNNMNGSTFGAWNVELRYRECSPSLKGGLVDLRGGHRNDEPRHSFGKPAYSAYNITAGSKRRNIRQPNSKSINSGRRMIIQDFRLNELATASKCGSRSECEESRCASNDPYYALPFYALHERKDKVHAKKYGRGVSTTIMRSRHSNMATVRRKLTTHTNDKNTGFAKFRDLQESRDSQVSPMIKRNSIRNRVVCFGASHEGVKKAPTRDSKRQSADPCGFASKSSTMETIGQCGEKDEKHEIPLWVLNNRNSDSTLHLFQKQTRPIPAANTHPSNLNSSLFQLRATKPSRSITKIAIEMIANAINEAKLLNPKPKQRVPPLQHSENPTRPSETFQRETTRHKMHLDRNTWTPSKLSSMVHTLPMTTQTPDAPQPERMSPQTEPNPQEQSQQDENPHQPHQQSQPSEPELPRQQDPETQVHTFPNCDDNRDFRGDVCDAATSVSSKSSSATPIVCLCKLCGTPERVSLQSSKRGFKHNLTNSVQFPPNPQLGTIPNCSISKLRFLTMEIVALISLGGILTMGLIGFVDSLFRAYVVGSCPCAGPGGARPDGVSSWPQVTADGLKSGVVNWVTCHIEEGALSTINLKTSKKCT